MTRIPVTTVADVEISVDEEGTFYATFDAANGAGAQEHSSLAFSNLKDSIIRSLPRHTLTTYAAPNVGFHGGLRPVTIDVRGVRTVKYYGNGRTIDPTRLEFARVTPEQAAAWNVLLDELEQAKGKVHAELDAMAESFEKVTANQLLAEKLEGPGS